MGKIGVRDPTAQDYKAIEEAGKVAEKPGILEASEIRGARKVAWCYPIASGRDIGICWLLGHLDKSKIRTKPPTRILSVEALNQGIIEHPV
jgi:hypothetical protein